MSDLGQKFLTAALGADGARALQKAVEREPQLAQVLIPRTILGWLNFTTEVEYEGAIPGVENSYVQFQKSEDGFSGSIGLQDGVYSFEKSSVYHLAAAVAMALEVEPEDFDSRLRDAILVKLGKSIDTLAKAQVLVKELRSPAALKPTRMTTHGAYHIEHGGGADRPYGVFHTRTNAPVQAGISSLKDAQQIASWHQNRYGGYFHPGLSKKVLDPGAGYELQHQHHDFGDGETMTAVTAHLNGQKVGEALLTHRGGVLDPETISVDPQHRRKGLASAMYAHAQQVTGKTVKPSHDQTPAGQALWAGNAKQRQFGKVELPGRSHQPTPPQGPQAPTAPQKQPQTAAKPPKQLSVGKSEAQQPCEICGGHQFESDRFRGCICFRELSKHVHTTAYGDGYVLEFDRGMDVDAVRALVKSFRSRS